LELDHSLPTMGAGGLRTARWTLVLLAAQSQADDSHTAPQQAQDETHAFCEALIASEGRLGLTTPNGKNRTLSSKFAGTTSSVIGEKAVAIDWVSD
jgi:hypothetical protein